MLKELYKKHNKCLKNITLLVIIIEILEHLIIPLLLGIFINPILFTITLFPTCELIIYPIIIGFIIFGKV